MFIYYIKSNLGKIILVLFALACISFSVFLSVVAQKADRISLELAQSAMGGRIDSLK